MNATDEKIEDTLFDQLFRAKGASRLSRPAIVSEDVSLDYRDVLDEIRATARTLFSLGVGKSDRVALMLDNTPDYVLAFFAVTALGAIAVPVEYRGGSERLRFIFEETTPLLCLHRPEMRLPAGLPTQWVTAAIDPATGRLELSAGDSAADFPAGVDGGDPAVILYSAGSTGRPKGAVLKHAQLMAIARSLSAIVGLHPEHRELILNPLTHSGAWQRVTSTFLSGGCIVFPEGLFSVPGLIDWIERFQINGFFTTPPFIRMMLRTLPDKFAGRVDGLDSIEIASAPLAPDELLRLMDLFPNTRVFFQYGSTECSRALILDARAHPDKLQTVGVPTPGVEVAIRDAQGNVVGPHQEGEVLLAAPQRAATYWKRPELDAQRFDGRWLLTGDHGYVDRDGFLTLLGRKDDMINCGGHSYFPAEVEVELGAVEGFAAYLIAGVPDPQKVLTQIPWAFVVPDSPGDCSAERFYALARRRLPAHMVPRSVVPIPSIPLTPSGKPSRRLAVELYGPPQEEV